ncbi:hypothetical protein GS399_05920 [Pedobacter sp. HMF7647]|uniref:Carboxypeptidase-like regulatory domain-containing protein n=1 Tax=Hufsiella arboris TaxID=2695275 RepID=A0A7K1Y7F6_9SPHI|nr:hypothetical protein [Hufsiella arboris]
MINLKKHLLFLIILLIGQTSLAQQKIKGSIRDLLTDKPIPDVTVINQKNFELTKSDSVGNFSITAKNGDLLVLKSFVYQTDTLLITSQKPITIYLVSKQNMLKEVTVKGVKTNLGDMIDREFHGQTITNQIDKKYYPASGNKQDIGGVVVHVGYGENKAAAKRRKIEREFSLYSEIDSVFSEKNVGNYVPLREADLRDFIDLYKPSIKTYTQSGFNLAVYLNDSYKEFMALPPDKRKLPPLKSVGNR